MENCNEFEYLREFADDVMFILGIEEKLLENLKVNNKHRKTNFNSEIRILKKFKLFKYLGIN